MCKELSRKKYNLVIGLILLWGLLINVVIRTLFQSKSYIILVVAAVGCYIAAFTGLAMGKFLNSLVVSFFEYNLIAMFTSVLLNFVLRNYVLSMVKAFVTVMLILVLLLILSRITPMLLRGLNDIKIFFVCEFFCLLVLGVIMFISISTGITILALMLCSCVGCVFVKEQEEPKTLHNAVASAFSLYFMLVACLYVCR